MENLALMACRSNFSGGSYAGVIWSSQASKDGFEALNDHFGRQTFVRIVPIVSMLFYKPKDFQQHKDRFIKNWYEEVMLPTS